MQRTLRYASVVMALGLAGSACAQRYLTEVFTNAQVTVTPDIIYGTNIDFLTSNLANQAQVFADAQQLQGLVTQGQPIPAPFFNPGDASTALKVTNLRFDLYQPSQSADSEQARPLVVYLHTGNALPPPFNGSPNGLRTDSTAVEVCRRMARRGYVAASVSYRLGWNPLAPTEEERRGQLLNAIYRALHDTRHFIRTMKADAAGPNTYKIDPNKIIVFGEGTGGYIALANATLNRGEELFIEKFRPDPFNPNVSYVDTLIVGNLEGLGGLLTLYRPNGFSSSSNMCVNMGGALADNSWLEPGDVPMVSFHTVFDPFAPFTQGIVIVPTTGGPVVEVNGPNTFMPLVNQYGNNWPFVNLNGDPVTNAARGRYGNTYDGVTLNTNLEGLFPMLRPRWPAPATDEASPWQWWDPNSTLAQSPSPIPGLTVHQVSLGSNPDMSPGKAKAYIDTVMAYANPRIVCALQLGPCAVTNVAIEETDPIAAALDIFPNPATDVINIVSGAATIERYELFDLNGRLLGSNTVNTDRIVLPRQGLQAGVYFVQLHFAEGSMIRRVVLD